MRLLRNLARRKLRTALTVAGITIGIWALVVFSSMANKINSLVAGGSEYFENKILVTDATGGGFAALPISADAVDQVAALEGVAAAVPQVSFFADEELSAGFGQPDQVEGGVAGADEGRETFVLQAIQGRLLTPEDEGADVAVVGSDLARERGAVVGQPLEIRGRTFEVVGILEPTLTAPDATVYIPLRAAQEMFFEQVPPVVRENAQPTDLGSQVVVYPEPGAEIAALADEIESTVENSATLTGEEFDELIGGSVA